MLSKHVSLVLDASATLIDVSIENVINICSGFSFEVNNIISAFFCNILNEQRSIQWV